MFADGSLPPLKCDEWHTDRTAAKGLTWRSGQGVEIFFVFSLIFQFSAKSEHFEYRHMG